jgi:hypothetical protein
MKAFVTVVTLGLAACWAASTCAENPTEKMLADMKKCAVCNVMAEKPDLMKDMTWESHKIEGGMLCVASVPKEKMKEFAALHEKMLKQIEHVKADSQQGKAVALCGFCQGMGELEKAGAKQQHIQTATGFISLVTSQDSAVVAKIHAQADKAIAEQKKMAEANQVSSTN